MNSSLSCQIDNSQVYLKGDMENYWDATKGYIESHTSCLEDQHSCPGPTLIMIDDSRASKEDCDVLHIMKTISFSIQGLMVVLIMWTEHRGFVHTVHRHLLPLAAGYYPRNRDRDTRLSPGHRRMFSYIWWFLSSGACLKTNMKGCRWSGVRQSVWIPWAISSISQQTFWDGVHKHTTSSLPVHIHYKHGRRKKPVSPHDMEKDTASLMWSSPIDAHVVPV